MEKKLSKMLLVILTLFDCDQTEEVNSFLIGLMGVTWPLIIIK